MMEKNGKNGKRKFLIISKQAESNDLAWQLKKEDNNVVLYIEDKDNKDVGDGFVDKTDDWVSLVDWADVIIFDDNGFGQLADKLRKEGKHVVGGSVYTDKLESDREFGQEEMKECGMIILPHWDFTDFDDAITFIKENPGRYVIKPNGKAQNEKELSFIGQEEDGKDVVQVLEHYKKNWSKKIKSFQVQKFASGVEVAVGTFFNGKDFIYPINVNFEHKRMFPGEIGPSTGEMGCYDDKTEVLTKRGWTLFKDLKEKDEICTLNPFNHNIEYHKPDAIVSFSHHKKLVSIQNQTLDVMVTLDHNMYVCSQQDARNNNNNFKFVRAKDLEYQSLVKRTGAWIGQEISTFILPMVEIGHYEGRQVVLHETPEIEIPMDEWLAFMGIWLSDGCESSNRVSICQKVPDKTKKIEKLLEKLPFNFKKGEDNFNVTSKQLGSYLKQFGKAPDKYVPDFVKELSPRQISIFLDWFTLGDGTIMKNDFRIFYTCSKRLADDLQELLLKIGRVGILKERSRLGQRWIVDHYANSEIPQYEVLERVKKLDSWIDKRDTEIIDYDGIVYCANVENHVMYVRRNGKPLWCGNTLCYWSQSNAIFKQTLEKMKKKIADSGYVGYFDINCIANSKGIFPLEITSRFGYPTIQIQMEGITSKMGDLFYEISHGNTFDLKTKRGFQIGVIIAVPPFPFKDSAAFKRYSEEASLLFKKPNTDGVHLGDVKFIDSDWRLAGQSGYALVVTGAASTVEAARQIAYKRVTNIMIPNMFYRTDIGVRWHFDSDRLHTWGYIY